MQEQNDHTLKDGLRDLPEYDPPEHLWSAINSSIKGLDPHATPLQKAIAQLPTYDPPQEVWEGLSAQLQPEAKRRWLRPLSVAASIIVILGCAIWVSNLSPTPSSSDGQEVLVASVSYSQEVVDDQLMIHDWNEEDEAYDLVADLCEDTPFLCSNPNLQVLRAELDELTKAKEELEQAIGKYGSDQNLIEEITDIELQRTDILKKMIEQITLS